MLPRRSIILVILLTDLIAALSLGDSHEGPTNPKKFQAHHGKRYERPYVASEAILTRVGHRPMGRLDRYETTAEVSGVALTTSIVIVGVMLFIASFLMIWGCSHGMSTMLQNNCEAELKLEDDLESFYSAQSDEELLCRQQSTRSLASELQEEGLAELRYIWMKEIKPLFPEIEADVYLSPPDSKGGTDVMLLRFLRAERNQGADDPVRSAADRLRETAEFRRDYRCMDFYRKGMARKLFMHGSNAGASVYFGDIGLRDCEGEPVLIGRTSLMTDTRAPGRKPADDMIPATHLRACMFVCERAASETKTKGSFIVDMGPYPADAMAKYSNCRFWDADGAVDDSACKTERRAPEPSVKPHLVDHLSLQGLSVLKESMRMMQTYYPELLKKVYFYRPSMMFWIVFNIFSLWVPADTRSRFVMVNQGEEHKHFLAAGVQDSSKVPVELGGSGEPLDGDRFLAVAMDRYDSLAMLPE